MNLIKQIEEKLHIIFVEQANLAICFASNNKELRSEFKMYFTSEDYNCFINSFGDREEVVIPQTVELFWERVEKQKNK